MNFRIIQVPYKTKEKQEVILYRDKDWETDQEKVTLRAYILPDEL